jgi:hypothetical protein
VEAFKHIQGMSWSIVTTATCKRNIANLRQAIEQAEKQEPVAWMLPEYGDVLSAAEVNGKPGIYNIPLYTAPPKREWVGLTDEEVWVAYEKGMYEEMWFARAVEAKLKEKNT